MKMMSKKTSTAMLAALQLDSVHLFSGLAPHRHIPQPRRQRSASKGTTRRPQGATSLLPNASAMPRSISLAGSPETLLQSLLSEASRSSL